MASNVAKIVLRGRRFIKQICYPTTYAINNERTRRNCLDLHHCSIRFYSSEQEEAPTIDLKDIEKIVKNRKLVLLDVRHPDELKEEGFVPTAFNINVDELDGALKLDASAFKKKYGFQKPSLADQIIVYCRSGKRSTTAGQILLKHNFENVLNFKGSWMAWSEKHPEDVQNKKK